MSQNRVCVNLRGEEYEPMIPGTKCPVSAGVLEQWYWREQRTLAEIKAHLSQDFNVIASEQSISRWMKWCGIRVDSRRCEKTQKSISSRISNLSTFPRGFINQSHKDKFINAGKKASITVNLRRHKEGTVDFSCDCCGKLCKKWKSQTREGRKNYCSMSCASRHKNRKRTYLQKISCPFCYQRTLQPRSATPSHKRFSCVSCGKYTVRPIIELGLRQDLEEVGALDDGRILASAFSDTTKGNPSIRKQEAPQ